MGYCFFYPTFYSLLHQVSVKLTTVTTIPTTVHYKLTTVTTVPTTVHYKLNTVTTIPTTVHYKLNTVTTIPTTVHYKLTTVTTIPATVHYSKTCNDFLRLPDVIVTSQPYLRCFSVMKVLCSGFTTVLTLQTRGIRRKFS